MTQANNDIHVMREEARSAKIDAASTIARLKAAQQELELLKERDAARRAEIRLQSLHDRDLGSTIQRVSMDSLVVPPLDRGRDTAMVKGNYKDFAKASRMSPSPDAQSRNVDNYFTRRPGDDDDAISKSGLVSNERRASMATGSSTDVEVNSESRKEKEKYAQTHPTSSSTPSRRPHYSLPSPAPAPMSTSACASAAVRGVSSRSSQPRDRNVTNGRQTFSSNRINAHITTSGDRASSDSEVNDKSVYNKKSSPRREIHKNAERNEETSAKLQLPAPSSAAQYFSDSELEHYEKHSKSSLARLMRYSEETSGTTRQQQTVAAAYPPRPPLLSTSDKRAENHSLHFPHTSSLKRNDDRGVPSNRSSLRFDAYVNSSSSRNDKDTSTAMESSKDVGRQSSMQDRAELLYSKNRGNRIISATTAPAPALVPATFITSELPIPDKVAASNLSSSSMRAGTKYASPSTSAHRRETEVLRSDRLQRMYDRVTSSSAPSSWRDSDSSESDDSDS